MKYRHENVKTKIICTIGPASDTKDAIKRMIDKGMDLARINFSHGTHDEKTRIFQTIRDIHGDIPIICDIQGPKIRVGKMAENVVLKQDAPIVITTQDIKGDKERIPISYKDLTKDVKVGDVIFLSDGMISLEVLIIDETDLRCTVLSGGLLSSNMGVNLPNVDLTETVPTRKDKEDLEFIAGLGPEYVAVSFVGNPKGVERVRKTLDGFGGQPIKLISKIERQVALKHIDDILRVSDGLMVARGDLGVEIPPERVPALQKEIILKCNRAGKPVIVATQMLESMIFQSVPTRAEASDVFNAVLDGADAVMLSGETAIGKYPEKAVEIMSKIASKAEEVMPQRDPHRFDSENQGISELLGHTVYTMVEEFQSDALKILAITRTGYSATMISKYRPSAPILATTPDKKVNNQLGLLWGIKPILFEVDPKDSTDEVMKKAVQTAMDKGHLTMEDNVIIVCAASLVPRKTNIIGIFRVADVIDKD